MLTLIVVCFALVVSLLLRAGGDTYEPFYGGGWPVIQLVILTLAHGAAGLASWLGDYRSWANRLLWMMALHLHAVTYALNWPVYHGLTGTVAQTPDLLPNLSAFFLILLPSLLMYGGPVAALINPPRREET